MWHPGVYGCASLSLHHQLEYIREAWHIRVVTIVDEAHLLKKETLASKFRQALRAIRGQIKKSLTFELQDNPNIDSMEPPFSSN